MPTGPVISRETVESRLRAIFGFSSVDTIRLTYVVAKQAMDVEGCFAECGVAGGGGSAPMALALMEYGDGRPLHLFDSFQGLPFCGVHDKGQIGHEPGNYLIDPNLPESERLRSTNISAHTVIQVRENLKKWGVERPNNIFHEGWFQHTLPGIQLAPIAMLRLDGDLYESTMCCLDHLYDQVATGGYVWLDEGGMPETLGGHLAYRHFFEKRSQPIPTIIGQSDTGAFYWRKT